MIKRFELRKVRYMPAELEPGILYVAAEFGAAAHLCACGCGAVVRTPLDPTEWSLEEAEQGPSLEPSIGNWQERCQSHYWIRSGAVIWAPKWSVAQIEAGRLVEQERRAAYYDALYSRKSTRARRLWNRVKSLFNGWIQRL